MNLGDKLKEIRKRLKLTQQEFGEKIDVDKSFIGQIEAGHKKMGLKTINKICSTYKIDPREFFPTKETEDTDKNAITIIQNMPGKDKEVTLKIIQMLQEMTTNEKREILKHAEKEKLWTERKKIKRKTSK